MPTTKTIISTTKGVYSEQSEAHSFKLENFVTSSNVEDKILAIDNTGNVKILTSASVGATSRFEYYRHAGAQIISGTSHVLFAINGQASYYNGNLRTWNSGTSVFRPEKIGAVYTLRLEGEITPLGGNPIFHIDFIQSGSNPETDEIFRHKQSVEVQVRNTGPHQHLHGIFTVFVDQGLYVSGGIFMAATSGPAITISTASLMIKEG